MRRSLACISLSTAIGLGSLIVSTSTANSATVTEFREVGRNFMAELYLENGDICSVQLNRLSRSNFADFVVMEGSYSCDFGSAGAALYLIYTNRPIQNDEGIVLENYYRTDERILIENGRFYDEILDDFASLTTLAPPDTSTRHTATRPGEPFNTGRLIADPGSYINMRQWAGMDAPIVNIAYPGDRVTVWSVQRIGAFSWYEVALYGSNRVGWIRGDLVRLD